jgi:hypothetical protein
MTVARHPHALKGFFGPLGNSETVHCDKHLLTRDLMGRSVSPI